MKKWMAVLLSALMLAGLAGCGRKPAASDGNARYATGGNAYYASAGNAWYATGGNARG